MHHNIIGEMWPVNEYTPLIFLLSVFTVHFNEIQTSDKHTPRKETTVDQMSR
jgi:hypothetical protein